MIGGSLDSSRVISVGRRVRSIGVKKRDRVTPVRISNLGMQWVPGMNTASKGVACAWILVVPSGI